MRRQTGCSFLLNPILTEVIFGMWGCTPDIFFLNLSLKTIGRKILELWDGVDNHNPLPIEKAYCAYSVT